jgi:hypothetical protein
MDFGVFSFYHGTSVGAGLPKVIFTGVMPREFWK